MDDLGKSIPAAEGMVDAEQGGKRMPHNELCLNCGTKLIDSFCHHCGQKDIPKRQKLGELLTNFVSSFWSYEGKFFLTTKYLITRPGFLAVEYNAGRRESYYHPARMYVFISFVFFLLFVSLPDDDKDNTNVVVKGDAEDVKELEEGLKKANVDSLFTALGKQDSTLKKVFSQPWADSLKKSSGRNKYKGFRLSKADFKSVSAYDSAQQRKPEKDRDGWFVRKLTIRAIELNERYDGDTGKFSEDFGKAFSDNFSKVLFYLLPVFALLLWLLYIRRDFFYSEHLVFTIYYYNFFFLAGSLQLLVGIVPYVSWLTTFIGFWIFFYLLFAMKRMYQQSWGKTILKFTFFVGAFLIFVSIGLGLNAMIALMLI